MYAITDPAFLALIEKGIPLERLEKRLQPSVGWFELIPKTDDSGGNKAFAAEKRDHDDFGNYSRVGFLGKEESLLEVIYADWRVVEDAGTTHQEIAELLELCQPKNSENKNYLSREDHQRAEEAANSRLHHDYEFILTGDLTNGIQECPWCSDQFSNTVGVIKKRTLLSPGAQELSSSAHLPAEPVEFAIVTYLLPHLIKEHYFFEGRGTPYRADPKFLIEAFDLERRQGVK